MPEEFDIMKPISTDLDIGGTMFDTGQEERQVQKNVYTPPKDDGVYHAEFGYLTREEAALLAEDGEDERQVVTSEAFDGVGAAVGCSSTSRGSAVSNSGSQSVGAAAAVSRQSASQAEKKGDLIDRLPVRMNGKPVESRTGKLVLIIVFIAIFAMAFLPFIFFALTDLFTIFS